MGFDSQMAGLILIVQPVTMAILAPQAGKLSDRISPFKLASIGMAVCSAGLCSFIFLPMTNSLLHVVINLLVMGVGIGLFSTPNTNAVMSCVHPRDFGVTTSLLATVRTLGQSSGMAVITLIVSAHLGQASFAEASQTELGDIVQTGFITFTILCLAGIFFSMQRKRA
jgi:MFS family permease